MDTAAPPETIMERPSHSQQHSPSDERADKPAAGLAPYSDPYLTLGVARTASPEQIKDAYFGKVREHPPERDPETFKAIRAAYDRLRNAARRLETDMLLVQAPDLPTDLSAPRLDLEVHREDLLRIARLLSDVERTDFREHFRKV